jgi:hypothetical protein
MIQLKYFRWKLQRITTAATQNIPRNKPCLYSSFDETTGNVFLSGYASLSLRSSVKLRLFLLAFSVTCVKLTFETVLIGGPHAAAAPSSTLFTQLQHHSTRLNDKIVSPRGLTVVCILYTDHTPPQTTHVS